MKRQTTKTIRLYLKWVLWILLFQFILANISASFYAHKFTHFYDGPPPPHTSQNVFVKTWKLFVGPKTYKNTDEPPAPFYCDSFKLKLANGNLIDGLYSSPDSSKPCVIFLHGMTMNKSAMFQEAAKFKQWGYGVLLIDFRGHGKSEGNNSCFGFCETEELQKAFQWAGQKGNHKIIVYGFSLGAIVAMKAVSDHLIQPTAVIADAPFENLLNHLRARSKALGFPEEPFGTLVTLWIGIENGYNGFRHDVGDYAKNIHCPILLESGEKDGFTPVSEVTHVFDNLPSTNKKLVFYAEAEHESYMRVDPVKWENEMQSFLSGVGQ